MTCVHLQQLVHLCQESDLRLSSSDLIHIVCQQCGKQEVCPSNLITEMDATEMDDPDEEDSPAPAEPGSR